MALHPEDLCRCKSGHRRIRSDVDQPAASHLGLEISALPAGALIAPEDGATQRTPIAVQHYQTVHLPGQADTDNLAGTHAAFFHNSADAFRRRIPPIRWILFCPAVVRLMQRVFHCF